MSEFLRPVPTAEQAALKALSTRRRQLSELIAMEKTRLAPDYERPARVHEVCGRTVKMA